MFGDLELSSGSTRIEKRDELAQRMSNKGMKTIPLSTILMPLTMVSHPMLVVVLVLRD